MDCRILGVQTLVGCPLSSTLTWRNEDQRAGSFINYVTTIIVIYRHLYLPQPPISFFSLPSLSHPPPPTPTTIIPTLTKCHLCLPFLLPQPFTFNHVNQCHPPSFWWWRNLWSKPLWTEFRSTSISNSPLSQISPETSTICWMQFIL